MEKEASIDMNFVDLFGSVVWAKLQPYPWWPCYIFDPVDFCMKDNLGPSIKRRARASVRNKEYVIYFYGDEEQFGFVSPQNIRNFTTHFDLPTINPFYYEKHNKGIELASFDCTLPKEKRVAWSRKHAIITKNHDYRNSDEELCLNCPSIWVNPPVAETAVSFFASKKYLRVLIITINSINNLLSQRRSSYESRQLFIAEVLCNNGKKDEATCRKPCRKLPHICSENCFRDQNHTCCQYWCGVACIRSRSAKKPRVTTKQNHFKSTSTTTATAARSSTSKGRITHNIS